MARKNGWSHAEICKLFTLRDIEGLKWSAVAAEMPRRSQEACQVQYGKLADKGRALVISSVQVRQAPPSRAPARAVPTSRLIAVAELMQRIGVQGVTAGLLGDPLPGRSALDRKRARGGL